MCATSTTTGIWLRATFRSKPAADSPTPLVPIVTRKRSSAFSWPLTSRHKFFDFLLQIGGAAGLLQKIDGTRIDAVTRQGGTRMARAIQDRSARQADLQSGGEFFAGQPG